MKDLFVKLSFVGIAGLLFSCQKSAVDHPRPNPVKPVKVIQASKTALEAQYVGLRVEAAKRLAESQGRRFRLKSIDGQPQIMTKDYRPNRVNATVVKGVVIAILLG